MKISVKKLDIIFSLILTFIYEIGALIYYDRSLF